MQNRIHNKDNRTKTASSFTEKFADFFGFKGAAQGIEKDSLNVSIVNRTLTVELGSIIGNKSLADQVQKVNS